MKKTQFLVDEEIGEKSRVVLVSSLFHAQVCCVARVERGNRGKSKCEPMDVKANPLLPRQQHVVQEKAFQDLVLKGEQGEMT